MLYPPTVCRKGIHQCGLWYLPFSEKCIVQWWNISTYDSLIKIQWETCYSKSKLYCKTSQGKNWEKKRCYR